MSLGTNIMEKSKFLYNSVVINNNSKKMVLKKKYIYAYTV